MAAVVTIGQSEAAKSSISGAPPIGSVRTDQLTGQLNRLDYK